MTASPEAREAARRGDIAGAMILLCAVCHGRAPYEVAGCAREEKESMYGLSFMKRWDHPLAGLVAVEIGPGSRNCSPRYRP